MKTPNVSLAQAEYADQCATLHVAQDQAVADALERARVVGVLFAWASGDGDDREVSIEPFGCTLSWSTPLSQEECARLGQPSGRVEHYSSFDGDDCDKACSAAAKAIEAGEAG